MVAALVTRDEELLMTRSGHGPAGGVWDVPRSAVLAGETLAEAVVRTMLQCTGYGAALCGPFAGWQEDLEFIDTDHVLTMFFHVVLLEGSESDPGSITGVVEAAWISTYRVTDLATRDGLVEFLSDQSIIDRVL